MFINGGFNMEHPKKIITGALLIAIFVLVVSVSSWYVWNEMYFGDVCSCAIPLPILIPVLASVGLLTGTLVYYMFSPQFEKRRVDKDIILRMLNKSEKAVVNAIIEGGGEISQARIGQATGLSKVSVFRSLERLKQRGIIEKESMGKTNSVRLAGDIMGMIE